MRTRIFVAIAATVVSTVVTSGCANRPGELTAKAESVLAPKVDQIRKIAATGNYEKLAQAIAQLKLLVEREKTLGQVSGQRAVAIEDAADALLNDLTPSAPATTSAPASTPPSTKSPSPTPSQTPTPSATPTPSPTPSASPTPTNTTPSPLVSISG